MQRVALSLFHRPNLPSSAPSPLPPLSLCMDGFSLNNTQCNDETYNSIWQFAVPKSKISKSKKRMKTTTQKRIQLKKNIVVDERTGELTLKHKLPFNWKDYLPE